MILRRQARLAAGLLVLWVAAVGLGSCTSRERPKASPPAPSAPPLPEPPPESAPAQGLDAQGRLVVDAIEYPWSALGRLNLAGRGFCTAAMIGEDAVAFPVRCLYDQRESRRRVPDEMHFVPAYQRERVILHAGIRRIATDGRFPARRQAPTLDALVHGWAIAYLDRPLGRQTGWLGLEPSSTESVTQEPAAAVGIRAGYRWQLPHVVTARLGCAEPSARTGGPRPARPCRDVAADPELLELSLRKGEVRLMAPGLRLSSVGRPPPPGTAARPRPHRTAEALLRILGYLPPGPVQEAAGGPHAAVRAFQRDHGLQPTGTASIDLLAALVHSLRHGTLRGGLLSQAPFAP